MLLHGDKYWNIVFGFLTKLDALQKKNCKGYVLWALNKQCKLTV